MGAAGYALYITYAPNFTFFIGEITSKKRNFIGLYLVIYKDIFNSAVSSYSILFFWEFKWNLLIKPFFTIVGQDLVIILMLREIIE